MLSKVIAQANIDHAEKWFERADKIVIVTHVSPDGDAIGSSLGLWHFLESQEKTVNVIVPNAFPDFLRWMPGAKDIIRYDKYTEFANKLLNEADVICCLDFNALSRIDAMADAVNKGLIVKRDLDGGQMSRDMTLYVDEDGKAYHIYSSEENLTLQIAELSDDYLSHTGNYVRVAPAGHNEAPAIFKKDGTYWMITSGCTGWAPNEARMFSSSSIFGPWSQHPNPCVGPKSELTFGGQSTYILKVEGKKDAFIFMADIWRPEHPSDARYIWLPVQFKEGIPYVEWMDNWTLDFFQ